MIRIEIGEPIVKVSIRISDKDGETTAEEWKWFESVLMRRIGRFDDRFKEGVHYVDFLVRRRGEFDVEGSERYVKSIVKILKKIVAESNNVELKIK